MPEDIDRSHPFPNLTKAAVLPPSINDDPDNPFTSSRSLSSSISPGVGFTSASSIEGGQPRSPSPQLPPEQDHDTWFQPSTSLPFAGFQRPSFTSSSDMLQPTGFVRPGTKSVIAPSAAALAKARERLKSWGEDSEDTENVNISGVVTPLPQPSFQRPALRAMDNSLPTPESPSPSTFSRPVILKKTPAADQSAIKQKSFRSPLIKSTPVKSHPTSPLNPRVNLTSTANLSQQSRVPLMPSTPLRTTTTTFSVQTPRRPPTRTLRTTPAPFVTPFKPGRRPGEPGWVKYQESMRKEKAGGPSGKPSASASETRNMSRTRHHKTFFDLSARLSTG